MAVSRIASRLRRTENNTSPGKPPIGYVLDDDLDIIRVDTQWLRFFCDPIETNPWGTFPLSEAEIWSRVNQLDPPHDTTRCRANRNVWDYCNACETTRIAEFIRDGWPETTDDAEPITVDVNNWPAWMLIDGNHRAAAAMMTNKPWLDIVVVGFWDIALSMFVTGDYLD